MILGGSGFLGARLISELAARGVAPAEIHAAARRPVARAFSHILDVLDLAALEGLLEDLAPQHVISCAAISSLAECRQDPARAVRLNAGVPEFLAGWTARRGARLVHVSTDLVFGGALPPRTGFDERAPVDPCSEYGSSKALGERAVLSNDPRALVVRFSLLYGDSGGRGLGASDSILAALARGERPPLFTDEWRTPLAVGDAARALIELAQLDTSGTLHVAGPERISRHAFGLLLLSQLGHGSDHVLPVTRARADWASERPADTTLDTSLARRLLRTKLHPPVDGLAREHALPCTA